MDGHLVAVEIRIKGSAYKRMQPDGFSFHKDGKECLYSQTMQRWRTVKEHRMVFDNLFQNVPHFRAFFFHKFFCAFHGLDKIFFFKFLDDEGLKKLQRHSFGKTALMNFQLGPHDDNASSRIVNALAEEVLAKTALFTFK